MRNEVIETDGWRGVYGFTDEFDVDAHNPRIEVVIEGRLKRSIYTHIYRSGAIAHPLQENSYATSRGLMTGP